MHQGPDPTHPPPAQQVPLTQSLSSQQKVDKNTSVTRTRLYRMSVEDATKSQEPLGRGGLGLHVRAGQWHLVPEQPAWLVVAQRREVGPPPGLAPAS